MPTAELRCGVSRYGILNNANHTIISRKPDSIRLYTFRQGRSQFRSGRGFGQ